MRSFLCTAATVLALTTSTLLGADYPLSGDNTTITFIGAKPGGKHEGGFKTITGTASLPGEDLTELKLSLDIDMNSLYSDNPKLTGHLKSPDFFGVNSNPKSKFVSTKVEKSDAGHKITGNLTMCGQTKSITIPAQISVKGDAIAVQSKFSIDRTQWGMTYGRGKIDDEVSLSVKVNAKR